MNEILKAVLLGQVRHYVGMAGASLVTLGLMQVGDEGSFDKIATGIVMGAIALISAWWTNGGQAKATKWLKHLTSTDNVKEAIEAAQQAPAGSAVTPAAVAKLLIAAFVLSWFLAGGTPANAAGQTRPGVEPATIGLPPLTGNPVKDISNAVNQQAAANEQVASSILTDFANFISGDTTGAANLAISIQDTLDGNGQICFDAMSNASKVFKSNPLPAAGSQPTEGLITILERLRLLAITANKLCGLPACTQVFADASGAIGQLSPITLAAIPSFHDLCAKVPTVAIAQPSRSLPVTTAPPPVNTAAPK